MGEFSPWHVIIVLLVFALLFGSRKLPDAARSLGRSMRIFRAEMQTAQNEPTTPVTPSAVTEAAPATEVVQDAVPPTAPPTTA